MSESKQCPAALREAGFIQQKQNGLFALRLHSVGGDLTSEQLRDIADVSLRHADGMVHLTTRQGIEIHNVRLVNLDAARVALAAAGMAMGTCGPRVRGIVACPGSSTCRWGLADTKEIARELDQRYFGSETPHKFKISVTGCPNNCAKATENDLGIMGGVLPRWDGDGCSRCDLCVHSCPAAAIARDGDDYSADREACILCGVCIALCPTSSWKAERRGYTLFIGGTMGRKPRLGTRLPELIEGKERLYTLAEKVIGYYRANGKQRERFGHLMDRLGAEAVKRAICDE